MLLLEMEDRSAKIMGKPIGIFICKSSITMYFLASDRIFIKIPWNINCKSINPW